MSSLKFSAGLVQSPKRARSASATIEMVAQAAQVSIATVSRVLNRTVAVSDAKRRAVEKAVAKLGFVPHPAARGLAGGRSFTVGVVTQAIDSPYYGTVMRGIEDEFESTGNMPLFVSGHWSAAEEAKCIETLCSRRIDGIIVLTGSLGDEALSALARRLPVVVTGRHLEAPGLISLNFDNALGGFLATRLLIESGHARIACISGPANQPNAKDRLRGYRKALKSAQIAFDPALVVPGDFREPSGTQAVEALLARRQKFTAIFSLNDQMAYGAALALYRHGLRIPDDVSLVGFDDLPGSQFTLPPLTSVRQPAYELGCLVASAMMHLLGGNAAAGSLPQPTLTLRESVRNLNPGKQRLLQGRVDKKMR